MSAVADNGTERREEQGWLARLAHADLFQLTIIAYAVLFASVSLFLEHGLGIIGFSKTPYLNAGGYLLAVIVLGFALLSNRVKPGFFAFSPLQILILASLSVSTVIGIANHNAWSYIVAWNIYILTGILLFSLFRHNRDAAGGNDPLGLIFSWPFLLFMLAATALSVFSRDNLYQYMLTEVIALYAITVRRSWIEKGFGALIFLLVHLGSNEGFVQVEINRASILAIGVTGAIFLVWRRWFITMLFLAIAAIGGLSYALSLDDAALQAWPRNIREAVQLMKGDDIYNHISSYQRIYEGQKVMEDFQDAPATETLFGKGLGRTVDMSGAADRSVGQHALLGVLEVHNIHFIHFAILHKFGWFGLATFAILVISILSMLVVDMARGRLDDAIMFFYLYVIYVLVFAMPASNHLIGNPLWPAFLGMLCHLRLKTGALTQRQPAL